MTTPTSIYPQLPESDDTKVFRLNKVEQVQKEISSERDKRDQLYKKYNKVISFLSHAENCVAFVGAVSGSVGVVGVITVPIGVALGGLAIGCVGMNLALKFFSKKFRAKAKKHDEIRVAAETKLNTVSELVSQAIDDGDISHEEYVLINNELRKFNGMKEAIRTQTKAREESERNQKEIDDQVEKKVLERMELQKKDIIEKLSNLQ